MNGIHEVRGSIPLISTKRPRKRSFRFRQAAGGSLDAFPGLRRTRIDRSVEVEIEDSRRNYDSRLISYRDAVARVAAIDGARDRDWQIRPASGWVWLTRSGWRSSSRNTWNG